MGGLGCLSHVLGRRDNGSRIRDQGCPGVSTLPHPPSFLEKCEAKSKISYDFMLIVHKNLPPSMLSHAIILDQIVSVHIIGCDANFRVTPTSSSPSFNNRNTWSAGFTNKSHTILLSLLSVISFVNSSVCVSANRLSLS